MTPKERALLTSIVQWCRDAADRAAVSKRFDEGTGLLRAAAKLEQVLTEDTQ